MIRQGQLIKDNYGQVGVIVEIQREHIYEPFNRNRMGITRERRNYQCLILMGDKLEQRPIYYRHNSYQLDDTYYTIDVQPEDVRTYDRWKIEVMK